MSKAMITGAALGVMSILLAGCGQAENGQAQAAVGAEAVITPAALATSAALAQGAAPRAVSAAIEAHARECRAEGGRFVAGPGFDTRLALNGDAAPDHVLDYGAAACEGAGEDYFGAARGGRRDDGCGRMGCRVEVWLSGPNGHQLALGSSVWSVQTVRDVQPARVRFSAMSMPGCEASSAEGCHAEWGWNGSAFVRLRWLTRDGVAAADEVSPEVQASGAGASRTLPFRAGTYGMGQKVLLPRTGEYVYPSTLYVSATEFGGYPPCPVSDLVVQGREARLTYQCPDDCEAGQCSTPPRSVATVRALSADRVSINVAGDLEYMNGDYTYVGPER